jgi:hypothetical protein
MPRQHKPKALECEQRVARALAGLRSGEWATPYQAAKETGASRHTVVRRWAGGKSRTDARETQQKLTAAEEKVLADWITHLTSTGHPARHDFIREMAEEIRNKRSKEIQMRSEIPLGQSWIQQFLKRHPYLQTCISRSIETSRIKEVTKEVVISFYDALKACMEKFQISWENVYNMDETGKTLTYKANSRLCHWYSSGHICCCGFSATEKVSSSTRSSGMDHSHRVCLCGWNINCTIYNLQRGELDV